MKEPKKGISRRKFMVRTLAGGGGVLLGTLIVGRNPIRRAIYEEAETETSLFYLGNTSDPMIWFEITPDNHITFHSPKVEMGQGNFTGLTQIAAEELGVEINQIKTVHAASATGNIDQLCTGGSTSIAGLWQPLRELAATMREMLIQTAARNWKVSASELTVQKGVISGANHSTTFGEIISENKDWEIPDTPPLKPISEFKFIGQPIKRVDLTEKITGAPIFGMDATFPDMVYGAIVRSDKIGAKFVSADATKAENMPGVIAIVYEDDFVGVVAETYTQAENAKRVIDVKWEISNDLQTTEDLNKAIKVGNGTKQVTQKSGSPEGILDDAREKSDPLFIEQKYSSPIGAHAQMEPNGAVAFFEGDKVTLKISTQVVKLTRSEVADRLGIDEENVNIIPTFLGGGFGRRLHTPHAAQVAVMAKAVGKPVKCFYNRQEEFQNDTFRPPTEHLLRAKLTQNGSIEAIEHNYATGDVMYGSPLVPGIAGTLLGADIGAMRGGAFHYKGIENLQSIFWHIELPFATSWWRSLGLLANTFAIESFMDELAETAGKNPIDFRLQHIEDDDRGKRLKSVIEKVREISGFTQKSENGIGMGFACSTDAGTPCAQVAKVKVDGKKIQILEFYCAIDPGLAVNPDQIKAQVEGCINMGISSSLLEKMYIKDGALQPIIYGPYKMAQMRHSPRVIEVSIINGTGVPGAVGEPPLGPVGAALANAIYNATGKRLRNMPLEEDLKSLQ